MPWTQQCEFTIVLHNMSFYPLIRADAVLIVISHRTTEWPHGGLEKSGAVGEWVEPIQSFNLSYLNMVCSHPMVLQLAQVISIVLLFNFQGFSRQYNLVKIDEIEGSFYLCILPLTVFTCAYFPLQKNLLTKEGSTLLHLIVSKKHMNHMNKAIIVNEKHYLFSSIQYQKPLYSDCNVSK